MAKLYRPTDVEISEEPVGAVEELARIGMAFEVRTTLRSGARGRGPGGPDLTPTLLPQTGEGEHLAGGPGA